MVVLRSTTPWVAVSSLKSSNLLTVISMVVVPVGVATASTGISGSPWRQRATLEYSLISKEKAIKPAVTVEMREKWKLFPNCSCYSPSGWESFLKPGLLLAEERVNQDWAETFLPALTQVPQRFHSERRGRLRS